MNNQAAGKVESAELGQEAAAPYPVGHGIVNEDSPEQDEHCKRMEFHPFGKRAGNQGRRNNGEHALEGDESQFGNRAVSQDGHADARQAYFV